jgi:aminopeptidase N
MSSKSSLAAMAVFATVSASGGAAGATPQISVALVQRIDMAHVALDLRFDYASRTASGSARLEFTALAPTRVVVLDAVGLRISRITDQRGRPVAFALANDQVDGALHVFLNQTLRAGARSRLQVEYETSYANETDPGNIWGSFGKGLRFHVPSPTDSRRKFEIWSSNSPTSARYWYPSNDRPDDLRTFEVRATVPEGTEVVATGKLLERTRVPGQTAQTNWHWASTIPHQNHRSAIVVGNFSSTIARSGNTLITSHGYPEELDGLNASIRRLSDIVAWMQATVGSAIHSEGYNQIFVQEVPWTMVSPGLSVATENFVDSAEVHRDFFYMWDDLQAEGVAEQWFGVDVAPESWADIWLAKGISRYLATLYNEHRNGEAEVHLSQYHVFGDHLTLQSGWSAGDRTAVSPETIEDPAAFVSGNAPYIRAGVVLRLLELEVGRPALLQAIARFHNRMRGKAAKTADFMQVVSEVSGRDLSGFARQWIIGANQPALMARWTYDPATSQIRLVVNQTQDTGYFGGKIEVEVDRVTHTVTLDASATSTLTIPATRAPEYVALDPASRWIATLDETWDIKALSAAAASATSPSLRRKAMIGLANEVAKTAPDSAERAAARQLFAEVVSGSSYWRLKATALGQLRALAPKAADGTTLILDPMVRETLVTVIRGQVRDEAWVRFNALLLLGEARDRAYAGLYTSLLRDPSDRVIAAAARALGKTGDPSAFDTLVALESHPSWKNQSRISMLDGLGELGDPRGIEIALRCLLDPGGARWTLVTPVWDYRLAAAVALKKLGAGGRGLDALLPALESALASRQVYDSFYLANLMVALGDPRAKASLDRIAGVFGDDPRAAAAIDALKTQLP